MGTNLSFPTTSREPSLNTTEFCTARARLCRTYGSEKGSTYIWKIFTGRMKMPNWPDGFMLYSKLWFVFNSTYVLLFLKMNVRLHLIRAWPKFNLISENLSVLLWVVDDSLYTHRIALKKDYPKKKNEWTCLHRLPWTTTFWRLWQGRLSSLLDKSSLVKKTNSTVLQFVESPMQWTQTLHSLNRLLQIDSVISKLVSD